MLTPEERRAYNAWRRENYGEHIKYREKIRQLRAKGINDPEQFIADEKKREAELDARRELEKEFPWLRYARLVAKRRNRSEEYQARRAEKKRLKESEDYVNRLIALEEELAKKNSPPPPEMGNEGERG